MKKVGSGIIVLLAVWLFQACGGHAGNNSKANADSISKADADSSSRKDTLTKIGPPLEKGDVEFAMEAASGGLTEVALGKLAQEHGANIRVKNFGAMMIKDHSKANDKLMALAKSKKMALPTVPNASDQSIIDKLSKKSGKDFDEAYVSDMIDDHKKDIKTFQYALKNCSDPGLKAFASKTLPVLKNHLDAINTIHDSMK
jgi:putative membrane protein